MAFGVRDGLRMAALIVLPPLGAAFIVALLLLLGIPPHLVFLPGFAVKSGLQSLGIVVANRVGVLVTVGLWWGIIMFVVLARRRRPSRSS